MSESRDTYNGQSERPDQIRRIILDLVWLTPGILAVAPYYMRPALSRSVVDQLAYLLGLYGWLFAHSMRILIALPTVVYILRWIRNGNRYALGA